MGRLTLNAASFAQFEKTVLVLGMLLGLAVFGATFATDPVWAILWISIALSGI